jgi:hypothetical protein
MLGYGKKSIFSFLIFILLITSFAFTKPILAQENQDTQPTPTEQQFMPKAAMEVKPILNEIAIKPGETVSREMTVTSVANIPLPIKAYTRSFVATDETGGSDYPDDKKPDAVQNWFKIESPDFILQPKASNTIKIQISVPADTRPGGHYATLFFESLIPKDILSETSFYLSSRIGALFFFVVGGDINEKGEVSEFSTNRFWRHQDINFDVAFSNMGNVHVRPISQLTIYDWRGKLIDTVQDKGNTTLPEKTRKWVLSWTKQPWFGRYSAKLETKLDLESPVQTKTVQFYVIPATEIAWGYTLLLLILFIVRGRHRINRAFHVLVNKDMKNPKKL